MQAIWRWRDDRWWLIGLHDLDPVYGYVRPQHDGLHRWQTWGLGGLERRRSLAVVALVEAVRRSHPSLLIPELFEDSFLPTPTNAAAVPTASMSSSHSVTTA